MREGVSPFSEEKVRGTEGGAVRGGTGRKGRTDIGTLINSLINGKSLNLKTMFYSCTLSKYLNRHTEFTWNAHVLG